MFYNIKRIFFIAFYPLTYSATLLTTMSTLERSSAMYRAVTVLDQL